MKQIDARRNIRLTLWFGFSWMFLPIIPVLVPYLLGLGFTMTQFLELQAIFGLAVAIFEVPSGYFADLLGRRRALLWGSVISAIGFTYLIFSRSYLDFVIYQLLVAVGLSLTSGADLSLLYDSGKTLEEEAGIKRSLGADLISKFYFFRLSAEAISAVCGGVLASLSYQSVLIATAVIGWVPAGMALFIKEPPVQRAKIQTHKENFKKVFMQLFVNNGVLRLLYLNSDKGG